MKICCCINSINNSSQDNVKNKTTKTYTLIFHVGRKFSVILQIYLFFHWDNKMNTEVEIGSVITCLHKIRKNPYACIFYSTLLIVLPVTSVMQVVPNSLLSLTLSQFIFMVTHKISFSWTHTSTCIKKDLLDEKCNARKFAK